MDNYQQPPEIPQSQNSQDYKPYNWQPPQENMGKKGLIFSVLGLILIWFPILDIILWIKGAKKSYKGYKANLGRNQAKVGLVFTLISAHFYLVFLSYMFVIAWGFLFAHKIGAF